jgi:hypothetical protein
MLASEIRKWPEAFDWPPRVWQLLQASVVMFAPGVLAARLASRGYPTSLRMCIRTVVAFVLGSALGHWFALADGVSRAEFLKVWPQLGLSAAC